MNLLYLLGLALQAQDAGKVPVTLQSFTRAETDLYFGQFAKSTGIGKLGHRREMASVDRQDVVRMNRDTLYSSGIFDLDAGPLAVTLPDPGRRYLAMQVISQDHYTIDVAYGPARREYTRERVGTRYVALLVRILANPDSKSDLEAARALQDGVLVKQTGSGPGRWEAPHWDEESRKNIREALLNLGSAAGGFSGDGFGAKGEVDPVLHLIGTAAGWGGNPRSAAVYQGRYPKENDGNIPHVLKVKDVPVDGFWSISVYNAKGYFEKNDLGLYSINGLTAVPDADGSYTIRFGGGGGQNFLPTPAGWNFTIRLYRPRKEILDGTWTFPEAVPAR